MVAAALLEYSYSGRASQKNTLFFCLQLTFKLVYIVNDQYKDHRRTLINNGAQE